MPHVLFFVTLEELILVATHLIGTAVLWFGCSRAPSRQALTYMPVNGTLDEQRPRRGNGDVVERIETWGPRNKIFLKGERTLATKE